MSRIAFITGATSGIGKATAEAFAGAGIDLILCGRRQERLDEVAAELSSKVKVTTLVFDVRDKGAVLAAVGSLHDDWKDIAILVNNAGNAHGMGTLDEGDPDDWDAMIDGNVKGLLYVSKAIIPLLLERGKGHIVNISSIAGKQTYVNGIRLLRIKGRGGSNQRGNAPRTDAARHQNNQYSAGCRGDGIFACPLQRR
jgi:NADP-dependent 3-hydroxy acid dehydrogenase YdfG